MISREVFVAWLPVGWTSRPPTGVACSYFSYGPGALTKEKAYGLSAQPDISAFMHQDLLQCHDLACVFPLNLGTIWYLCGNHFPHRNTVGR